MIRLPCLLPYLASTTEDALPKFSNHGFSQVLLYSTCGGKSGCKTERPNFHQELQKEELEAEGFSDGA